MLACIISKIGNASSCFKRYTPGIMILPKVKEDEEMPKARAAVPELEKMVNNDFIVFRGRGIE